MNDSLRRIFCRYVSGKPFDRPYGRKLRERIGKKFCTNVESQSTSAVFLFLSKASFYGENTYEAESLAQYVMVSENYWCLIVHLVSLRWSTSKVQCTLEICALPPALPNISAQKQYSFAEPDWVSFIYLISELHLSSSPFASVPLFCHIDLRHNA